MGRRALILKPKIGATMKKIIFSIGIVLLAASGSFAENLGCFEPSQVVQIWAQYRGGDGAAVSPTSPTAKVFSPVDTTTASFTPTVAEIDSSGSPGVVRGSFTLGASPALGVWVVQYKGTIGSVVHVGSDTFEVRPAGKCGTVPPANFSSLSISGAGRVDAQVKGMDNDVVTAAAIAASAVGPSELGRTTASILAGAAGCNGGTNSSTVFATSLTQTASNHWKATQLITFITGTLAGQTAQVTGYSWTGSVGCLTVSASLGLTATPGVGDTFLVVKE